MSSPSPTPDALADRYEDVIRHAATFELDAAAFERLRQRRDRWGVGAFVVDAGRILFVEDGDRWYLPGGRCEPGESLIEGAVREVREETGVEIRVTDLAAIAEQTFRHDGATFTYYFATFVGDPLEPTVTDDPGTPGEAIERAAWLEAVPATTFDRDLVVALARRHT